MAPLVIGYARVSTEEQADALPPQVSRLHAAGCDRVISDVESGRSNDRDGLLELMALVRAGDVREVVVDRLDRLGRDAAYADTLLAECGARGVTVRALVGGVIETTTPQGFLMARLQTGLAEMESRMLSLRIRRQFTVYRAEGRHLRRRKPFGYQGGPDHHLAPHPEQWPQALRIIDELRMIGSFSGVASRMPEWCDWKPAPTNLQGWFCNPVIRGHIGHLYDKRSGKGWRQHWQHIQYDQHPALISEADWRDLAEMLRRPRNRFLGGGTTDTKHGLTGLLRCASCGHLMRRNSSAGVAWWRCRHHLCQERGGAREERILPVVIAACVAQAHHLAQIATEQPGPDPAIAAMADELQLMERMAARNPGNRAMAAAVEEQRQRIEALQRVDQPVIDPGTLQALQDPHFFSAATAEQQRALFAAVLQSVLIGVHGDPIAPQPRRSPAG
jgi:DNA invertase Pin-like site-specific DNA recombinase